MFHGLDVNKAQSIFKFLPVLCFTESYIYQVFAQMLTFLSLTAYVFFFSDQIQPFLLQLDDLNEYNLQMVPGNDASLTVSLGHLTWLSCEMWGTIYVDYWMIVCTLTF